MKYPIVILTALEVEREAVLLHLKNQTIENHPETGTDYVKGTFSKNNMDLDIIVARTDQTNVNAALETERVLEYYKPEYVFYVGVAGGLKDVSVGDIVIGTDVIGYERGKAEDSNFKPRPQFGASSYGLERFAASYANSNSWIEKKKELTETKFAPEIKTFTGTIASGEKVDASYQSDLHKHILQNASHALAIEMEGLGFLRVCQTRPSVKSLLLRGISDLVNDKGEMDGIGSQPYASKNVSAFLFGMISQLELNSPQQTEEQKEKDKWFEILCKLYPRGIEDKGIWLRADGDLSLIPNGTTGKGQWIEATRLLKLNGGGAITFESLKRCMLEDFPNNKDLIKL
ncbi:5'-methylthioadenosine/S-adenosylhomocysteine nucleosidase family protein [Seonamhaeicola marinus]|uniref:5'-methylthioadenosine/S-adenosylhomocysteine nucleosidase n=1 Tax=Seonamhaeicola marinus TaxID=1912246 RepID=A0A5D0HVH4_9FLAO|nr:5'-methylthioadenosine/S-adenosylhomocysteine nucleosidase [Seonamhaeicola marinus]TYA74931.1 5'-methylthioadenosine/S-adenosylhomocysteine nucleosidase [Seonamhaeicola marinus]